MATDGPITERRRAALLELTDIAGFDRKDVAFVTAFADRDAPPFKKTVSVVAWNSAVWFASEPESVILLRHAERPVNSLRDLL